jgi:hypothetical protein
MRAALSRAYIALTGRSQVGPALGPGTTERTMP